MILVIILEAVHVSGGNCYFGEHGQADHGNLGQCSKEHVQRPHPKIPLFFDITGGNCPFTPLLSANGWYY